MAEQLNVRLRERRGKRNNRRLRKAGEIPAVLYGHGEEAVSLALSADEVNTAMRHGSRLVQLAGAVKEQAFIRECQWNTWGTQVLHLDFTRVSEHERVQVQISIELRGESPGQKSGGVVEHLIHEIDMECEVTEIPEKLSLSVNSLELGDTITVADLELPASAVVALAPETILVQCVEVAELADEDEGEAAEAEPEVIGRKKEEEEEGKGK